MTAHAKLQRDAEQGTIVNLMRCIPEIAKNCEVTTKDHSGALIVTERSYALLQRTYQCLGISSFKHACRTKLDLKTKATARSLLIFAQSDEQLKPAVSAPAGSPKRGCQSTAAQERP